MNRSGRRSSSGRPRIPWSLSVVAALFATVAACAPGGSGSSNGDDDDDGATTPTPTATPTPIPGVHLTSDTTWTGAISVAENTIVDAGVTLTIASAATVSFAGGTRLRVEGTLAVVGIPSAPVVFAAAAPSRKWQGIHAGSGGSVSLAHAEISDATVGFGADVGALESSLLYVTFDAVNSPMILHANARICRGTFVNGSGSSSADAGTITIADTDFSGGSGGDTIVFSGTANIAIEHAHFGTQWHCLLHGGGANTSVSITSSQFDDASYAFMLSSLGSAASPAQIHDSTILVGSGGLVPTDGATTNVVNAENNYWGGTDGSFQNPPAGWDVTPFLGSAPAGAGPRAAGMGCEAP